MTVRIKDVAEAAGVSVATVSYVLNGTKRVSPEVEQRVREAARVLNYLPNAAARNLRRSENRIIGYELSVPDSKDPASFMQDFAYRLVLTAAKAGYHLITFATSAVHGRLNAYEQLIASERVDGFVIANTNWHDERIAYLLGKDVPFVAFGRTGNPTKFAYVDIDGAYGLRQVVLHLLERGHRRIAFIGWEEGSFSGDNRYEGYHQQLSEVGISLPPDYVQRVPNQIESGYQAAAILMQQPMPPTAIACVSDVLAIGANQYLAQQGYVVGSDIAITGFDDIPLASYVSPPLTTVLQPLDLIESRLMAILLGELDRQPVSQRQTVIKPELIIRESTDFYCRMDDSVVTTQRKGITLDESA